MDSIDWLVRETIGALDGTKDRLSMDQKHEERLYLERTFQYEMMMLKHLSPLNGRRIDLSNWYNGYKSYRYGAKPA